MREQQGGVSKRQGGERERGCVLVWMITWTQGVAAVVTDMLVVAWSAPRVLTYAYRRQCTTPPPHETFGALYGVVREQRLKGLGRLGTLTTAQACTFTYVPCTSESHAHQQPTS